MLHDASTEYALSKILVDCLAPSIRVAKGIINLDSERSDKSAGFPSQERFLTGIAQSLFSDGVRECALSISRETGCWTAEIVSH